MWSDTASGARTDRSQLAAVFDHLRVGDTLVVWRSDRLGRSLPHLIETIGEFALAGVTTRATLRLTRSLLSVCAGLGTLALLVLLWQVASQITLRGAYVSVTLALLAFLAGSAALGLTARSWSRCSTTLSTPLEI